MTSLRDVESGRHALLRPLAPAIRRGYVGKLLAGAEGMTMRRGNQSLSLQFDRLAD